MTMTHRPCVGCGDAEGMVRFDDETFVVEHGGASAKVAGLSGWRCPACGEVEFDHESALAYAKAGDELVLRARKLRSEELRRIRRKLGLSQVRAGKLTGGGHNAFSRYERGEAEPVSAVMNLFRLLERHPELLSEIEPGK
jgi:HTH-type transcriptional regulator/antitoxin MqsA